MAEIKDLNVVDDSNVARWPEGQAPSTVNDGARAGEGLEARAYKDTIDTTLVSTGASNAYAVTANRGVPDTETGLYHGFTVTFRANHENTGASTLTVTMNTSLQPTKDLVSVANTPLASGVIFADGFVTAVYNSTTDNFMVVSNTPSPLSADQSPQLTADLDVNGKAITTTVANGNVTLTPIGTGNPVLSGLSYPNADGTANQIMETDGAGNLSFADRDSAPISQVVKSGELAMTSGGTVSFTHSMGVIPTSTQIELICKVADAGYSVGDIIPYITVGSFEATTSSRGLTARYPASDPTNKVEVKIGAVGRGTATRFDTGVTDILLLDSAWNMIIKVIGEAAP